MSALSTRTLGIIDAMFSPEDRHQAAQLLLAECGNTLPGLGDLDAYSLERYRFAALKLSAGRLETLRHAVQLAQTDWRDLLVAAGFAEDLTAHEAWADDIVSS